MKLFSKFNGTNLKRKEIIVVSGLPRSGTSMLMRMLEEGGIEPLTDKVRTADEANPRGYYEYEAVKKLKDGEFSWLPQALGKAVKIISALLPYLPNDYSYYVLFTQRSFQEVLASQRAMLINRGEDPDKISDAEMATTFEKHLAQVMNWLSSQNNISTLYVDYNKMIKEPGRDVRRINSFLGDSLNVERMIAVIEPDLYRHRG
jgi:hypothetical protein